MTQDEIIELARQAWSDSGESWVAYGWFEDRAKALEAFAKLVAEKEREACAKVCDLAMLQNQEAINELEEDEHDFISFIQGAMTQLVKTSKSIRARGRA